MIRHSPLVILLLASCAVPFRTRAQYTLLDLPRESQAATVTQRIGTTEISITYSRPSVNGRTIFGDLVPYDEIWRAGANENTVFSCSGPVIVEGNVVEAGSYGLHVIPGRESWTIILSSDHTAWGSYFYTPDHDVVRARVTPREHPMTGTLTYSFTDVTSDGADVQLTWERVAVPFRVEVDVHAEVLAHLDDQLTGLTAFGWEAWYEAAHYCHQEGIAPEKAMAWVDRSIARQPNFENRSLKAEMLEQQGNTEEAAALREQLIDEATNAQLNRYGYQLANQGNVDEAVRMFELNAKRHPKDPNVHDSLGEGYMMAGRNDAAIKAFKRSLSMEPPANVKANSLRCLRKLGVDTARWEQDKG